MPKIICWPHDLQRHLKLKHPIKEKGYTTRSNQQQESTMLTQQQQQQKLYITSNKQLQEGTHLTQQKIYDTSQNQYQETHLKQQQQNFQFKHPFTVNVSGSTSCGKNVICENTIAELFNHD